MKNLVGGTIALALIGLLPAGASAAIIELSVCGNANGDLTGCHVFAGGSIDLTLTSASDQLTVTVKNNLTDPSAFLDVVGFDFADFGIEDFNATIDSKTVNSGTVKVDNMDIKDGAGTGFFIDFGFNVPGGSPAEALNSGDQITVVLNTFFHGTNTPVTIDLSGGILANAKIQSGNQSYTLSVPVPEPGSLFLFGLGLAALGCRVRPVSKRRA